MSSAPNPFQPPPSDTYEPTTYFVPTKAVLETPPSDRMAMNWGESLSYIFANPNWMMCLLFGAVCCLIPVIGHIVMLGFQYEAMLDLTASRGARYREFDFNRFVNYLKRGLWPFLFMFIVGMVLAPVMYVGIILVALVMAGLAAAIGPDGAPVVITVGITLGVLLGLVFGIGFNLVLQPLLLRTALTQDLGQAFQFRFAFDFVGRVRSEMLWALLFQFAVGIGVAIVGLVTCGIGIYPAAVVLTLMQAHLAFQLYELYRARGGETIAATSAD